MMSDVDEQFERIDSILGDDEKRKGARQKKPPRSRVSPEERQKFYQDSVC
ncbi:MAG: hypothetical protein GTO45_17100 [Candidatus Aminicenantes bacterium]|nr:hypothetical protein [Candidatus Aminicenantes bacterium]NIM80456.1 hypothetical protein [Candidatus Aminicenantes bacterium]NIN19849.1 hypothetical protein [Candidatus Aminicenantes bacterium]NIN43725.1 hypothetical protein [Candidatus Aminicenantes bacterium]NIN86475.1 hypothetical protein [Candidatus Aminicenantes bacterium]